MVNQIPPRTLPLPHKHQLTALHPPVAQAFPG
jgi:hypothetical protein